MRRFLIKLAFVHRTLWKRNRAYCWTVLLGPPPLLGCALAALAWAAVHEVAPNAPGPRGDAPWARWNRPVPQEGQPFTEATVALPRTDASGRFVGFQPGWLGAIQPMSVDATMEANVIGTALTTFTLDQPTIPLARILDAGPPTGLFVGTAKTFFVVQTSGVYALSVRLARSSTQSANCLVRFGSLKHRMVRNINLNTNGQALLSFAPTEFQLEPGLLSLAVAVGCWRGDHMIGPGDLTVMVRHPGELTLKPAAADEVIRPVPREPDGVDANAAQPSR